MQTPHPASPPALGAPARQPRRGARRDLYPLLPVGTRRLLDIGCAEGLGFAALRAQGVEVVGVEVRPAIALQARQRLDAVYCVDAETLDLPERYRGYFDAAVYADSLEHLREPARALEAVAAYLRPGGAVVLSVPNVRYWRVIAKLVLGRWDYAHTGILSRHHLRFFTRFSLEALLRSVGYTRILVQREPHHIHGADRLIHRHTRGVLREFLTQSHNVRAVKPAGGLHGSPVAPRLDVAPEYGEPAGK